MAKISKKIENKIEQIYDCLYDIKDLTTTVEGDYELESLVDEFVEQVEESIAEGDITIEALLDRFKNLE